MAAHVARLGIVPSLFDGGRIHRGMVETIETAQAYSHMTSYFILYRLSLSDIKDRYETGV
jgi:hypothetical protein